MGGQNWNEMPKVRGQNTQIEYQGLGTGIA